MPKCFQSGILYCYQQCIRIPMYNFCTLSPTLSILLIIAILLGLKFILMVFICISLMTNNSKHFFHVLIGCLCIFFGEMSILFFAHFLIGLFVLLLLNCRFVCFLRFYLVLERGEGREKERERNINVWLPLTWPPLGTWPTTQACALTGNPTSNPLVRSWHSIH